MNFELQTTVFLAHTQQAKAQKIANEVQALIEPKVENEFSKYDKFPNMYKSSSNRKLESHDFNTVILQVVDYAFAICNEGWTIKLNRDFNTIALYLNAPAQFTKNVYNIIHSAHLIAEIIEANDLTHHPQSL